jgi:hypothetical protein
MRKLCALLIAGLLAGPTLVDPAFPQPRWQYGWWQQGPSGQWRWVGACGPPPLGAPTRGLAVPLARAAVAIRPLGRGSGRPMGALPRRLGLPLAVAGSYSGAAFGKWLQI